jgi:exocyst complex component 8
MVTLQDKSPADWMAELAKNAGMSDTAKEKAERDARWMSDYSDDLTVAIALRDWDRAATLVEEGWFFVVFTLERA